MPFRQIVQEKSASYDHAGEVRFRTLVVDRDAMASALLADALKRSLECDAVACSGPTVLDAMVTSTFDIVIISADLNSKPGGGLELASAVSTAHPSLPIVMLLDQPSRKSVIDTFRAGARGVFNREDTISQFLDCIKHVKRGAMWVDAETTNYLMEELKGIPDTNSFAQGNCATLTACELQVVRIAALGKTNRVIAGEIGVSEHTVKNHLFRAFRKLGISSRVELPFHLRRMTR